MRRTRLVGVQEKLWPDWRHFGFLTDLDGTAVELDAFHRDHARVELAIKDLKEGAGMDHVPSGHFFANSAWLCCAVLAHDLVRWCAFLGGIVDKDELTVTRTLRTRYFSVPARLVNRSGIPRLRGPDKWPWAEPSSKRWESFASSISLLAERPSRTGAAADVYLCADNQAEQDSLVNDVPTAVDRHPTKSSAATALYRLSSWG